MSVKRRPGLSPINAQSVPPESGPPVKNDYTSITWYAGGGLLALPEGKATRLTLNDIVVSSADG
jgi:hypothetical protein